MDLNEEAFYFKIDFTPNSTILRESSEWILKRFNVKDLININKVMIFLILLHP
jgi:hypothetical protein